MPVLVSSEIGRLREVIIPTPAPERLLVNLDTRDDFVYDDIIDAELAKRKHRRSLASLERFARVHHVRDLLLDVAAIRKLESR